MYNLYKVILVGCV